METKKMKTKCVKKCKLSPNGGSCLGCNRTTDEIKRWKKLSIEERNIILDPNTLYRQWNTLV